REFLITLQQRAGAARRLLVGVPVDQVIVTGPGKEVLGPQPGERRVLEVFGERDTTVVFGRLEVGGDGLVAQRVPLVEYEEALAGCGPREPARVGGLAGGQRVGADDEGLKRARNRIEVPNRVERHLALLQTPGERPTRVEHNDLVLLDGWRGPPGRGEDHTRFTVLED